MNPTNPLSLIKEDHEKVKTMIEDFQDMDFDDKKDQAKKISETLAIHMGMEEEIFYPEIQKISDESGELITDAQSEHEDIKSHLRDIDQAESEDDLDDHINEMEETLLHHIDEEEAKIFPLAESNLQSNFTNLAAKMISYKANAKGEALLEKIKALV